MSNGPFDIDVDTLGNMRPISKVVFFSILKSKNVW